MGLGCGRARPDRGVRGHGERDACVYTTVETRMHPLLLSFIAFVSTMATASVYSPSGFDFSNTARLFCALYELAWNIWLIKLCRNHFLEDRGLPLPKATSTGTTIVGCLFKDGIVLGADTRATEGPIVADKNCEKARYLSAQARVTSLFT